MKQMGEQGFTLLEVVVAVAVLAVAAAALFPVFGSAGNKAALFHARATGLAIAGAKLEEQLALGTAGNWTAIDGGATSEGDTSGWHWTISGMTYSHDSDETATAGYLYEVTVTATPADTSDGNAIVLKRVVWRN